MKRVTSNAASIGLFLFFPLLFLLKREWKGGAAWLVILGLGLAGCFQHYYKTNTVTNIDRQTMEQLQRADKFFIVHYDDSIVALDNIVLKEDILEGIQVPVPPEHSKHLHPSHPEGNRVRRNDKIVTLLEVHLYFPGEKPSMTTASLPLSKIKRLEVYEFDRSATSLNHTLSWVGVGLGVASVVGLIAFAIACSCPQVYVNNNGTYEFTSGVYSGAIYSTLERSDYLALRDLSPVDGQYRLRIGNFRDEKQFINSTQLIRVTHSPGSNVLADRNGNFITYRDLQAPSKATIGDQEDATSIFRFTDQSMYSFDESPKGEQVPSVVLQFKKPVGVSKGKLLVHAGNSTWSGFVYREFAALFGNSYEKWREQQEHISGSNAYQWQVDQSLPLKVYVETSKGWKYMDYFPLTGNTASRDMIMELDLTGTEEIVKVKIESAFLFWNVDLAAMDFTPGEKITATTINPVSAVKSDGSNAAREVTQRDDSYLHLEGKDFLDLAFEASPGESGSKTSYFLASSGYYHSNAASKKSADMLQLARFRKPGAFNEFSKKKYQEVVENLAAN